MSRWRVGRGETGVSDSTLIYDGWRRPKGNSLHLRTGLLPRWWIGMRRCGGQPVVRPDRGRRSPSRPARTREAAVADLHRDRTLTTSFTDLWALGAASARWFFTRRAGAAPRKRGRREPDIAVLGLHGRRRPDRGHAEPCLAGLRPGRLSGRSRRVSGRPGRAGAEVHPGRAEDVFSGGPLHYHRDGPGYIVYSVGQNGIDEDGRTNGTISRTAPPPAATTSPFAYR